MYKTLSIVELDGLDLAEDFSHLNRINSDTLELFPSRDHENEKTITFWI